MISPFISSSGEKAILTWSLFPSKESAEPYWPAVQVAPLIVPSLLFPDESPAFVPVFSSKLYAATSPGVWASACIENKLRRKIDTI